MRLLSGRSVDLAGRTRYPGLTFPEPDAGLAGTWLTLHTVRSSLRDVQKGAPPLLPLLRSRAGSGPRARLPHASVPPSHRSSVRSRAEQAGFIASRRAGRLAGDRCAVAAVPVRFCITFQVHDDIRWCLRCNGTRVIKTRRECLNHMLILGERHMRKVLAEYGKHYKGHRLQRQPSRHYLPDRAEASSGRPNRRVRQSGPASVKRQFSAYAVVWHSRGHAEIAFARRPWCGRRKRRELLSSQLRGHISRGRAHKTSPKLRCIEAKPCDPYRTLGATIKGCP